ncbi:MAG TPA: tetratricopeptide repeat protein [Candidatus Acidoferrum sp.]|nr:tetratricopeptide repeat protein [Candidatus Acidoferrum sp.]
MGGLAALVALAGAVWGVMQDPQAPKSNPCEQEVFYHAPMTDQEIYLEFSRAVFRIEGHKDGEPVVGTGYLIDTEQGYVLTALHVVRDDFNNRALVIRATTPGLPGAKLILEPVEKLEPPYDVALLKVRDPTLLINNHIRSFDIAFQRIQQSSHYFNIGYPRGKDTQNKQSVEVQGFYEGRNLPGTPQFNIPKGLLLDVKQAVDEGHSGSPLIDEDGVVMGTCIENLSYNEAIYTPMDKIQDLLDRVAVDGRARSVDRELRAIRDEQDARRDLFVQELEWRSGSPSNLELFKWASLMSQTPRDYESRAALFSCPVQPAFEQRRLHGAKNMQIVKRLSFGGDAGKNLLSASQRALEQGRTDLAATFSTSALDLFRESNNVAGVADAYRELGKTSYQMQRYQDSSKYFEQALQVHPGSPTSAETKVFLAAAYEGNGQKPLAEQYAKEALPELEKSNDAYGTALGLDTLGKVAASNGKYSIAKKDFQDALNLYAQAGNDYGIISTQDRLQRLQNERSAYFPNLVHAFTGKENSKVLNVLGVGLSVLVYGLILWAGASYAVDGVRFLRRKIQKAREKPVEQDNDHNTPANLGG